MRWWWQHEVDVARASADRAEHEQLRATARRIEAEHADERARRLEKTLRPELLQNGFAEALRAAFGGLS